jgi:TetR/AcrR family transcriptional regulator, tetracycline repressor protein
VSTALAIIDKEGLEVLSLPRLARDLNVRAPSLYHHFADKAEILRAIARTIILETPTPRERSTENWVEWFVELSQNFRQTILAHRNAAPVLLQFMPRDVLARTYETGARFLGEAGVPEHLHVLILDGMDKLALGACITEAMKSPDKRAQVFPNVEPDAHPTLSRALAVDTRTPDELFAASIRSFLRGALAADRDPSSAPAG